ncbi:hypothetical protein C8Q80DRAFT_1161651 [Daedaleopsis nitida]|nr:hypothetical protein C8Q80DRAFT_1161651 [Daedaleopsis nitida]
MPATQRPLTTATTASATPYFAQTGSRPRPHNQAPSSSQLPAHPRVKIRETLTAKHPLVHAYLAQKKAEFLQAEADHRSNPDNAAWHVRDMSFTMSWWRHELAGRITDYSRKMKKPQRKAKSKSNAKEEKQPRMGWLNGWPMDEDEDAVDEEQAQQDWEAKMLEMSWGDVLSDIATNFGVRGQDAKNLFVVAALYVADKPSQDVHWALWSKNNSRASADETI